MSRTVDDRSMKLASNQEDPIHGGDVSYDLAIYLVGI